MPGEPASCPVCGSILLLGYGGRVPWHESGSQVSERPAARVD